MAELRKQYAHSNIHVESVAWVKSTAKKGSVSFTEGLSPEEVEVLQAKPPHLRVPYVSHLPKGPISELTMLFDRRYDFNDAEERELVEFLAEFYPAESDPGRLEPFPSLSSLH